MTSISSSRWYTVGLNPVNCVMFAPSSAMSQVVRSATERFWAKQRALAELNREILSNRLEAEKEAGPSTPTPRKKYILDVDTLECPICNEPFSPPVFQCDNGHTACSNCCQKIKTKGCPSCSLPIGRIRCLAIEKVIESLLVECEHGCATALKFREQDEHEKSTCKYRPVKCPALECTHTGPMSAISEHLAKEHKIQTVECCESTRSASFNMREHKDMVVLVKAKEAWLLVSLCYSVVLVHRFKCESVWVSKEVVFKLTVKPIPQMHQRVYSLESPLLPGDLEERLLYIPRHDNLFDVTVSLIT